MAKPGGALISAAALVSAAIVILASPPARAFGAKAEKPAGGEASSSSAASAPAPSGDFVWVKHSDGAKSCEGPGRPLEDDQNALAKAGIKVSGARKTHDGMMHIQVCGAATGTENAFRISRSELKEALGLGYRLEPGPKSDGKPSGN